MAITLYDISVGQFLQTLGALNGVLAKGAAFAAETGIDLTEIVDTRVHPDMFPFSFQVVSVCHHSRRAIESAKAGIAGPPGPAPEGGYPALQALVADAIASLKAETPEEINALEGKDVVFQMGETFKLPFTAEGFLTSFALPNFYFHATTTYAILRGKGVKLGKRDFMGQMRMKA
jgi:hypothetical protein